MTRTVTDAQRDNLDERATRPVVIVEWEHSGETEYLSCTGSRVIWDGNNYLPGHLQFKGLGDDGVARLSAIATTSRIAEVRNNSWRNGVCKIWDIPGVTSESTATEYTAEQAILIMDGKIQSSRWKDKSVSVTAVHYTIEGNRTPRNTADEFSNHIRPAGSLLVWEGETLVLEPPR